MCWRSASRERGGPSCASGRSQRKGHLLVRLTELAPEAGETAVQVGLDRSLRDVEGGGRVGLAQVGQVAEDHDAALPTWQGSERGRQSEAEGDRVAVVRRRAVEDDRAATARGV